MKILLQTRNVESSGIYKEACSMFIHYSRSSLVIRVTAIAQGVVVLSTSGFLYRVEEYNYAAISSIFGVLFTLILQFLHEDYQHKCETIITVISKIEESTEDNDLRVIAILAKDHMQRTTTYFGKFFIINGFFYFMIFIFVVLLFVSLYLH